jgi:hydrogenase 3 maturation protease
MGLGNVDRGDDGFGVRLVEALDDPASDFRQACTVIHAGMMPERFIGRAGDGSFEHVIFLDAVDFGGMPGAVVFLNADQIVARYPQISTHKISLGLLAKQVELGGKTKAWLLGVQPKSIKPGKSLSPEVRATLELVHQLLVEVAGEVLA